MSEVILDPIQTLDVYLGVLNKLTKNISVDYSFSKGPQNNTLPVENNTLPGQKSRSIYTSVLLNKEEERKIMVYETINALIKCKDNHNIFTKVYSFIEICGYNKYIINYLIPEYQSLKQRIHNKKDLIGVIKNIAELANGDLFSINILTECITTGYYQEITRLLYLNIRTFPDHERYFMRDDAYNLFHIVKWFAYDYEHLVDFTLTTEYRYYRYLIWKERRFMQSMYLRKFLTNPNRSLELLDLNKMICIIMEFNSS